MLCFPLGTIAYILVLIVIIVAILAIIRVLLSQLVPTYAFLGVVVEILKIVLWAVVAIAVIYLVVDLIACLFGLLPRLH